MFTITLEKVLMCLILIIPGYVIEKLKKSSANHLKTLSAVLIYGCSPCLIAGTFLKIDFSVESLLNMGLFFIIISVLQIAFMLIVYLAVRKKYVDASYRIITIGSVFGNVGYFGLPVVDALFAGQPEVLSYASIYVVSMNIILFTLGLFFLTCKKDAVKVKSCFLNPASIGLIVGLIFFITGAKNYMPMVMKDCINLLGQTSTPLSMIMLGIRLASMKFVKLFLNPKVYILASLKLILFPLFAYFTVVFLPLSQAFKSTVLVLSATPCAASVLSFAELYNKEEQMAANSVILTTLLSLITLPVLTLIL